MRRINPIYLFVAFNIAVFLFRDFIFPERSSVPLASELQEFLTGLGLLGYAGVVGIYAICSFFFIPILIPLNIACGALYGAYVGTAVSILGIVLGCVASTVSVRYVFTGMAEVIERRPAARKLLNQISERGTAVVILVRLAFIVPYLLQNIVLAVTSISTARLAALTAAGSLPGAAIYSFLGAGLVEADDANELAIYLGIPLLLLVAVTLAVKLLNRKFEAGG